MFGGIQLKLGSGVHLGNFQTFLHQNMCEVAQSIQVIFYRRQTNKNNNKKASNQEENETQPNRSARRATFLEG